MTKSKNIDKNQQLFGTFLVLLSGILYGLIGFFGLDLYHQGFAVPTMLFWRFFIAAIWMMCAYLIFRRPSKRKPSAVKRSKMWQLAMVGSISYAGGSAFFYLSSLHIGTGPAMVIFFSFPVFVTLFSVYFRHSAINQYVAFALLMVMTGMTLLNNGGAQVFDWSGVGLALIAAFSYGVYVYYSKHQTKEADSLWITLNVCLGCSLIFLFFTLAHHAFIWPTTWSAWRDILILGILSTAIPIQLLLNGLKYISSVKASILSVTEPLTTVVIGVLLLHESLSAIQMMGILIILFGALVIQFEKQPEFKTETLLK